MKAYLLSLLGAAFLAAAIGILTPEGTNGGIGKYVRLLSVLMIVCVIALPLPHAIADLRERLTDLTDQSPNGKDSFDARSQALLDNASRAYFASSLTAHLAERFSLNSDEITCAIRWKEADGETLPESITLILSGSARWHDPHELENYVADLLGCPCNTAIA